MQLIKRQLSAELYAAAQELPIVAILGPRQSGKSTLAKASFPDHTYISLENLDNRQFAENDPNGFLAQYRSGAIFDEIQRVPSLFSYLQTEVDEDGTPGRFILTGSHQFSLVKGITQTLAGRISLLRLLPLSLGELKSKHSLPELDELLIKGLYPRIHHQNIRSDRWLDGYIETYVEKDIRGLKNIGDLSKFITSSRCLLPAVANF